MKPKKRSKGRALIIAIISILLAIPLIILPIVTVVVNKMFFGKRYETDSWLRYSVEEFDGLQVERSDFSSQDVNLAGFQYSRKDQDVKGVVVLAHSFGGGGHIHYLPFIDYITKHGYYVFSYDIRGHDNSEGDAIRGLPQGIVDLDNALRHIKTIEEYKELPVALFGHSWGGYSVGNVLNLHPDVKAVAMIAGFNEAGDLLRHQGDQMTGGGMSVLMPYMNLYQRILFGKDITELDAVQGLKKSQAGVIIFHSKDDDVVPPQYGYDVFYDNFSQDERFTFVLYEDKGHANLIFSDEAVRYLAQFKTGLKSYLEENDLEKNEENVKKYWEENLDRIKAFEPNSELMDQVLALFDKYLEG